MARDKLGFSIDEWRALPWWQRRVYLEGIQEQARMMEEAQGGTTGSEGASDPAEALLMGTMDQVAGLGYGPG